MKNTPESFNKGSPKDFRPEFWQNEIKAKEQIADTKTLELQRLNQEFLHTEDPDQRLKLSGRIERIKGEIGMAEVIQKISKSQISGNNQEN